MPPGPPENNVIVTVFHGFVRFFCIELPTVKKLCRENRKIWNYEGESDSTPRPPNASDMRGRFV